MHILIGIILIGVLLGFFILSIYMNGKTPMPEGFDLESMGCASCSSSSCSFHPHKTEELKAEINQAIKNNNERCNK